MTTIGMHYQVLPGKEEAFVQGFTGVLALMKTLDGHVDTHLYRDVTDPQTYLIVSEWATKEAYAVFLNSDAFKSTIKWGREQILSARPQHKVYGE